MKELLEKSVENGTIWFLLGSLISADELLTKEDCEKSLKVIKEMQLAMKDDDLKMEINDYNKIMKYLDNAEDIVNADLEHYKN